MTYCVYLYTHIVHDSSACLADVLSLLRKPLFGKELPTRSVRIPAWIAFSSFAPTTQRHGDEDANLDNSDADGGLQSAETSSLPPKRQLSEFRASML